MVLLQSNSDNIIVPAESEGNKMESIDNRGDAKESVMDEEAKGDAKEAADTSDEALDKPVDQNKPVETEGNAMDTSEKKSSSPKEQSSKGGEVAESPTQAPAKADNAEEAEEEGDDAEDEEEEHEQKKGIYDMPLEVEGKRERHKVERIIIATPTPKKVAPVVPMGDGVPLGDIAYIEYQLQKHRADELKTMYRLLYGNAGTLREIKPKIRKFTGFGFQEDSPEFKKKVAYLNKLTRDQLIQIKNVLGLHSGGQSKDAVATTIMLFLMKTVDHARRVPTKRKSSAKTPKSAKRAKKAKSDDKIESDDDEDDDEGKEEDKPAAKTPAKASAKTPAKTPAKAAAKTPKKAAASATPKKKKDSAAAKDTVSKTDTDSDDSSTKKKAKKTPKKVIEDDTSSSSSAESHEETKPSEKELEAVIEELLSQVDLSQVSMKQMCQAVIEKFPGTNIGSRVDYLKSKIKQCLSTK